MPYSEEQSIALELFKDIIHDDLDYIYRGGFTNEITESILSLAETNLKQSELKSNLKKKIYFVMVEGLQNITRHQERKFADSPEKAGVFAIQKKGSHYFITTGNVINNTRVGALKTKLERINSLGQEELKDYYRNILTSGSFSDKGGAGLGLIEMARKSGEKLQFDFKEIDEFHSYFYLQTEIHLNSRQGNPFSFRTKHKPTENHDPFATVKKMHKLLNDKNISLLFKGKFNQDNIINLLSIIEGHMDISSSAIKVFNIMVEMLQNIAKHAEALKQRNGNPGVFFINQRKPEILLTSGNYIRVKNKEKLQARIDFVNSLNSEQVIDYYDELLIGAQSDTPKEVSLGLLDMRIKCENKLNYAFEEVDNKYCFFSIQTPVSMSVHSLKPMHIKATDDTPEVLLDASSGIFSIKKRSLPENAMEFYAPILEWLQKYALNPQPITILNVELEYFNTASSKQLVKVLFTLEHIGRKSDITVRWYYNPIDKDMQMIGRRFNRLINLNFEFIERY